MKEMKMEKKEVKGSQKHVLVLFPTGLQRRVPQS